MLNGGAVIIKHVKWGVVIIKHVKWGELLSLSMLSGGASCYD